MSKAGAKKKRLFNTCSNDSLENGMSVAGLEAEVEMDILEMSKREGGLLDRKHLKTSVFIAAVLGITGVFLVCKGQVLAMAGRSNWHGKRELAAK